MQIGERKEVGERKGREKGGNERERVAEGGDKDRTRESECVCVARETEFTLQHTN